MAPRPPRARRRKGARRRRRERAARDDAAGAGASHTTQSLVGLRRDARRRGADAEERRGAGRADGRGAPRRAPPFLPVWKPNFGCPTPSTRRNSLVDFHTGEKGFTLSKRGELAVLDELARAMPQGGLELAEPACWGAAASNAVVARGRGAAARLRWLALSRRAVAASWCFLSFEEFVQSHADAVEGRRRALRDAPVSWRRATDRRRAYVVGRRRREPGGPADFAGRGAAAAPRRDVYLDDARGG